MSPSKEYPPKKIKKKEKKKSEISSFLIPTSPRNPQNEIHHHSSQQSDRQHSRTKAIIKATLAPHPDTFRSPVEGHEGVEHGGEGDEGEEAGGDLADAVAEVEEADGQAA